MKVASPVGRSKIEDYAFLSDTQSGALVSRDGCVDWLCLPRFDSGACFAALLGGPENGTWRLTPQEKIKKRERRYRGDTLILETDLHTSGGAVRYIDFMPPRGTNPDMVRIIEGLAGQVTIRMELIIRFDYGSVVPWVRRRYGGLEAIAGPDGLILHTPIETRGEDLKTVAEFTVGKGDRVPFVLTWYPVARTAAARSPSRERATRHGKFLERLVEAFRLPGTLARRGHALAHHIERPHLRPDRWDRRCPHHFAAGGDRWRS